MEKLYPIGEAALLAGVTAETLRHYDRIGLVVPTKDEWTGYRYYTADDVVRINTVRALQSMDFTLAEIGEILKLEDFGKIIGALDRALAGADKKLEELRRARERILRAKGYYEQKRGERHARGEVYERTLEERKILLLKEPLEATADNLTDYHRHFYAQAGSRAKDFCFEDVAGIYADGGGERLFAVCKRYADIDGLATLPKGRYLCRMCERDRRAAAERELAALAVSMYGAEPQYAVSIVMLTGILNWEYEVQIFIGLP